MKKNLLKKLWAFLITALMVIANFQSVVVAEGGTTEGITNLNAKFSYSTDKGETYTDFPEDGNLVTLKKGDFIKAELSADIPNNGRLSDYRIQLSPTTNVKISTDGTSKTLYSRGKEAGTYKVVTDSDGITYIEFHLNDDILKESNISVTVDAIGEIDIEQNKKNDKQTKDIEIAGAKAQIIFDAQQKPSTLYIEKSNTGKNVYKAENGKYYQDYEITLKAADGDVTLKDIEDTFGGVTTVPANLKYTDENGNMITADSFDELNTKISGKSISQDKTAKITYSVCVADNQSALGEVYKNSTAETYKNKAKVNYTDDTNRDKTTYEKSADIQVSKLSVDKSGKYDPKTGKVKWKIIITPNDYANLEGYSEGELNTLIKNFTDTLGDYQSSSSEVPTIDKFEYDSQKKQYTYIYWTKVSDDLDVSGGATLKNKVTFETTNDESFEKEGLAKIDPAKGNIIKSVEGYNAENHTLTWNLSIKVSKGMKTLHVRDWTNMENYSGQNIHKIRKDLLNITVDGISVVENGQFVKNSIIKSTEFSDGDFWQFEFEDDYIKDKEMINLTYTTYAGDSLIDNATYVNTAQLDYTDGTGVQRYTEQSKAKWDNKVNVYINKTAKVNDTKDQIDYEVKVNAKDIEALSTDHDFILNDVVDSNFEIDPSSIQYGYYGLDPWNNIQTFKEASNNKVYSWAVGHDYYFDSPKGTYTSESNQFSIPVTDAFCKFLQDEAKVDESKKQDIWKQFGFYISYSAKPKDGKSFVNNGTTTVTNTISGNYNGHDLGAKQTTTEITPKKTVNKSVTTKNAGGEDTIYAYYTINVNPGGYTFNEGERLTGEDVLTKNFTYDTSSIQVTKLVDGKEVPVEKGSAKDQYEYRLNVKDNALTFYLPDSTSLVIKYRAVISLAFNDTFNDTNSNNSFTLKAGDTISQTDSKALVGVFTKPSGWVESETSTINVAKIDNEDGNGLKDTAFEIYETTWDPETRSMVDGNKVGSYTTDESGKIEVKGLAFDKYYVLYETVAPEGYSKYTAPYYFILPNDNTAPDVDESVVEIHRFNNHIGTITIADDKVNNELGSLKIRKSSENATTPSNTTFVVESTDRTESGESVFRQEIKYSQFNESGEYELSNLPFGTYTVTELTDTATIKHKILSVKANGEESSRAEVTLNKEKSDQTVSFVNTYSSDESFHGSLSLKKKIIGNLPENVLNSLKDQLQFKITNTATSESQTVYLKDFEYDSDSHTFTKEIDFDKAGTYSVEEVNASINGYTLSKEFSVNSVSAPGESDSVTVEIKNDVTTNVEVTNTYSQQTTSISVEKNWDDDNNRDAVRPNSVTVTLYANGKKTNKTLTLEDANKWKGIFENLEKYGSEGKEITYTVGENNAESYEEPSIAYDSEKKSFVITNKHIIATTSISGEKQWDDGDNQDGIRPRDITVNLYANGKFVTSTTVTADNKWQYEFKNLPVNESGNKITYTVSEDKVPTGYESEVKGTTIINKHTPETTSISGTKTWADNGNALGNRPGKITVRLFKTVGDTTREIAHQEISASDDWKYSFTDLPKNEKGKPVTYSVVEDPVEDYSVKYSKSEDGKVIDITNAYTPGETSVTIRKQWDDDNNRDGYRPNTVTVQLMANGEAYGDPYVLGENGVWEHTFDKLPVKINNKAVTYTVKELEVDHYTSEISKEDNVFVINNKHTPETTEVAGNKTWSDSDNKFSKRPKSITVNLYKVTNGEEEFVSSQEVKPDLFGKWTYSFKGLLRKENGQDISYVVRETVVHDYTAEYKEKGEIVNTLDTTDVTISKVDITGVNELEGAKLKITDNSTGKKVEEWISETTPHVISLPSGTYVLTEENAPENYVKADPITFTVENGQVTSTTASAVHDHTVTMIDGYQSHEITIKKTDVAGKEIEGAELVIVDKDNTVIDRWKSVKDKSHKVSVKPGTYTLNELIAPKGYQIASSITFVVSEDGTATSPDNISVKDNILIMIDDYSAKNVDISKVDVNGTEIEGAELQITGKAEGEESPITPITWISGTDGQNEDGTVKSHTVRLEPGEYTLSETKAPEGKRIAGSIDFKVDKEGSVSVKNTDGEYVRADTNTVTMVDEDIELTSFTVKKEWNDDNNTAGLAHPDSIRVQLIQDGHNYGDPVDIAPDEEGNWAYTWESLPKTDSTGKVFKYSVKEENVASYNSTISQEEGSYTAKITNTFIDNGKEVRISKENLGGKEIGGASLSVKNSNGEVISSWVSVEDESHTVKVQPGTYTLHEESAPAGYVVAQDITFTVDENGIVSVEDKEVSAVTMVDEDLLHSVKVSKVDATSNKEIAGAKLKITDTDGQEVESWISVKDESHEVSLKAGTYVLSEVAAPKGYKTAESITFHVDDQGKVTIQGQEVDKVVMKDEKTDRVQTGIHSNLMMYGFLSVFSILLAAIVLVIRKRFN